VTFWRTFTLALATQMAVYGAIIALWLLVLHWPAWLLATGYAFNQAVRSSAELARKRQVTA